MNTKTKRNNKSRRARSQAAGEHRQRPPTSGRRTHRRRSAPASGSHNVGPAIEVAAEGLLELHPNGYGFLRRLDRDCLPEESDVYVPAETIKTCSLRPGDLIAGTARSQRRDQGPRLVQVAALNGETMSEQPAARRRFDALTPINPEAWLHLETGREPLTTRVLDLLVPLGKGQRGLIVAPPRSGKTVLLQQIGQAIPRNHPEVDLNVLLIDERPEEVTDMRRNIPGRVFASSLDHTVENHVRLSRLVVERCRRLAESGRDVVLLLDSITRMARAFNKWVGNTGRTMTGGLDIKALDIPKHLFATARAFEEGGSLTILATALVETGSRMDDLIFEEFKGTGNLEIVLDRQLADRRVWPAIDIDRSGTRREELLLPPEMLGAATSLRRTLTHLNPVDAMQQLTTQLSKHATNAEFLHILRARAGAA